MWKRKEVNSVRGPFVDACNGCKNNTYMAKTAATKVALNFWKQKC